MKNENESMNKNSMNRVSVRTALSNLPKATCPAGFEHRLVRRLAGKNEAPKWYVTWAGAGLGFAAVVLFSIFTLNSKTDIVNSGMVGEPKSATNVMTSTPTDAPAIDVAIETQKDDSKLTTPESATTPELASEKDSAAQNRGKLPEGHFETVNQSTPANGSGGR